MSETLGLRRRRQPDQQDRLQRQDDHLQSRRAESADLEDSRCRRRRAGDHVQLHGDRPAAQMVDASGTTTYTLRRSRPAGPEGDAARDADATPTMPAATSRIQSSNAGGTSVDYTYDALNRLSTVTDNRLASGVTTYTYDDVGNLQAYAYPNGVKHDIHLQRAEPAHRSHRRERRRRRWRATPTRWAAPATGCRSPNWAAARSTTPTTRSTG